MKIETGPFYAIGNSGIFTTLCSTVLCTVIDFKRFWGQYRTHGKIEVKQQKKNNNRDSNVVPPALPYSSNQDRRQTVQKVRKRIRQDAVLYRSVQITTMLCLEFSLATDSACAYCVLCDTYCNEYQLFTLQ